MITAMGARVITFHVTSPTLYVIALAPPILIFGRIVREMCRSWLRPAQIFSGARSSHRSRHRRYANSGCASDQAEIK
jgi:hypothetical protein